MVASGLYRLIEVALTNLAYERESLRVYIVRTTFVRFNNISVFVRGPVSIICILPRF